MKLLFLLLLSTSVFASQNKGYVSQQEVINNNVTVYYERSKCPGICHELPSEWDMDTVSISNGVLIVDPQKLAAKNLLKEQRRQAEESGDANRAAAKAALKNALTVQQLRDALVIILGI